LSHPPQYPK